MSDQHEDRPEPREIKVTDKRMFTPDGELREEYRDLGDKSEAPGAAPASPPKAPAAEPPVVGAPPPRDPGGVPGGPGATPVAPPGGGAAQDRRSGGPGAVPEMPGAGGGAPFEIPSSGPGPQPSFFDLVGILAEPAAIYLGDAQLPDGGTAENLDAARLHIDLLDVLRRKTAGNLSAQESAVLEDVLYRLRMRYVQKRG